ncbi:MAG TPA: SgcJ/EcaC family oxidoreductase [Rhodanobacteraceae bacterium]|nr:SgcJ/EcaC family oxidoreductase [Rhodanobacteraceae bacterium]
MQSPSRKNCCVWAAVLPAVLAANLAAAAPGNGDVAAIRKLEQQFMTAFNAKDVNKIMAVYATGDQLFVFDVGTPRQHVGWADYKKDWEQVFAENPGPVHFDISDLAITAVGPVAYSHSIQGGYFTDKNGKRQNTLVRVTDVYRKQHGKWLIVQEHVSVPIDFKTMKPDMMSRP